MQTNAPGANQIDRYIAGFPPDVQRRLTQVRNAIRKALPDAAESISYRIPTYKLRGRPVIYFAAFSHHYSIYPANARLVSAFRAELEPYEFNNKGTIRFPFTGRVPTRLIARIAKFRAREVAGREKAKRSARQSFGPPRRASAGKP